MNNKEIEIAIKTINAKLDEALKNEAKTLGTENTIFWHMVANDYKMAMQALEKQMPKIPDVYGDSYSDGQLVYDMYSCPNCGENYEIESDHYDYCPKCGQHMDKSGEVFE